MNYDHNKTEKKWVDNWYKKNLYKAVDFSEKPKKYILAELPYPSGAALHAGHAMRYTVPDIYSRYLRMKGYNVLFPMGWDAFGLPAENYAVKTGIHPAKITQDTIKSYKESIKRMGYGIDWDREIDTTDPKYYKWTQWIFLKFYKAGLAEYKEMPIWWCEKLRTVLSDEEVLTDKKGNKISERGEYPVEKKMLKQWVLKIPEYAEKLIEGLSTVDFPDSIKNAQINWIGKSEGINISYKVKNSKDEITCFTTRPDTNFGATFVVIAPEHKLLGQLTTKKQLDEVNKYIGEVKNKSDLERQIEEKDKTGVFTGSYAINELTGFEMPVFVADYVLPDVGTGAVVGVPGHDKRDFLFAQKYNLEIIRVVSGPDGDISPIKSLENVFEENGIAVNSGFLDGLKTSDAKNKIMDFIEEKGFGSRTTTYKIRDWVFSRQRYWGEPIPLIHTQNGEIESICDPDDSKAVKEKLPLELPDVPDYNPSSDGSSPLEQNKEWVETTAGDGSPAKRETNTMPNWAGSCWYFMRYIDPTNDEFFADFKKLEYWMPVDKYFGGAEHTTMHLLYSRFWQQFLYDQRLVPQPEPYAWRINGGLLLGSDGKKMSKSRGNVVEPINIINEYGADALRLYICFLGPYDDTFPWNINGVKRTKKLVDTVFNLSQRAKEDVPVSKDTRRSFNIMLKKITEMVEELKMNTVVSEFMIFINKIKNEDEINIDMWKKFITVFAPFAPFVSEEIWANLNTGSGSVHLEIWPSFDEKYTEQDEFVIPIQINGKLRDEIKIVKGTTEKDLKNSVVEKEKIKKYLLDKEIKKFIYIPNKIVNIVV